MTRYSAHGHAQVGKMSPTYNSWRAMKARCLNPRDHKYAYYGGQGVTVCDRWLDFDNFLADMGERPAGMTLDRKENAEGYSLDNCRWASADTQKRNRSDNQWVTMLGRTQCVADWCREFDTPNPLAYIRHTRLGWSWEKALTTPRRRRWKRAPAKEGVHL